ncbi:peptide deformylase [Vibrio sp. S4M6]|uniref:peptide deformylase n=1 Tax=Vibrio sinus TaxID=2946865 RepID=UPI00202AB750|nr:peptide deformylase [Vibrio sinus]MCL9783198.1 peptide deformylase [Vibrio sinus]
MTLAIINNEESSNREVLQSCASKVGFPLSDEDQILIEEMKQRLFELEGVGLAAPQVGISKKIIVVYIPKNAALLRDDAKPYDMHTLINPSYRPLENSTVYSDIEACYSVKSKAGKVRRYQQIELTYQDEHGKTHRTIEESFYARVLQHEIDHIEGVLITDRLTSEDVQGTIEEMMSLRREELPEDKKEIFDKLVQEKTLSRTESER